MHALSIRETHKYVGTYQHLDEWRDIGSYEQIGEKDLDLIGEDDDACDPCEPLRRMVYVLVRAYDGVTDDEIKQALQASNTSAGCAHEYDCCGCRSYHASDAKRVTGDLWSFTVSSSRNF